ncbi:hypothetical protein BC829DRAFT_225842 [Chytridium lagenaria]|nr:hypothetical protein BC829DRAFT_225842 [Chytridium lagenaria]
MQSSKQILNEAEAFVTNLAGVLEINVTSTENLHEACLLSTLSVKQENEAFRNENETLKASLKDATLFEEGLSVALGINTEMANNVAEACVSSARQIKQDNDMYRRSLNEANGFVERLSDALGIDTNIENLHRVCLSSALSVKQENESFRKKNEDLQGLLVHKDQFIQKLSGELNIDVQKLQAEELAGLPESCLLSLANIKADLAKAMDEVVEKMQKECDVKELIVAERERAGALEAELLVQKEEAAKLLALNCGLTDDLDASKDALNALQQAVNSMKARLKAEDSAQQIVATLREKYEKLVEDFERVEDEKLALLEEIDSIQREHERQRAVKMESADVGTSTDVMEPEDLEELEQLRREVDEKMVIIQQLEMDLAESRKLLESIQLAQMLADSQILGNVVAFENSSFAFLELDMNSAAGEPLACLRSLIEQLSSKLPVFCSEILQAKQEKQMILVELQRAEAKLEAKREQSRALELKLEMLSAEVKSRDVDLENACNQILQCNAELTTKIEIIQGLEAGQQRASDDIRLRDTELEEKAEEIKILRNDQQKAFEELRLRNVDFEKKEEEMKTLGMYQQNALEDIRLRDADLEKKSEEIRALRLNVKNCSKK